MCTVYKISMACTVSIKHYVYYSQHMYKVHCTLYSMHANSDIFMYVFTSWNIFTHMYACVYECFINLAISDLTALREP